VRVLYLSHRVPYAPNRGDRIRAYHTLRHLRRAGVDVHLMALAHDREEEAKGATLEELAASADVIRIPRTTNYVRGAVGLATTRPLTHFLLDSAQVGARLADACRTFRPDVTVALCSGMVRFAMAPPLTGLPFVHDMLDVDSEKWRALATTSLPPLGWVYKREAHRLGEFEIRAARAAFSTLVISEREAETMTTMAPGARVEVVPSGVDIDYYLPPSGTSRRNEVIFTGVFSYAPNAMAAQWLLDEVWPVVRQRVADATLVFAGSGPSRALRAAAAADARVHVTGALDDLRPYLWRARVSAAPLFVARGLQNKVVEGLASGLPVVTTTAVAQGLPRALVEHCRVADDPASFAEALVKELSEASSPPPVDLLADFTWERTLANLVTLLDRAAASRSR
jgi:sugar transferase (PEP-CTERM/EpsH1 system associated)